MKLVWRVILTLSCLSSISFVYSATCSCAGVPLLNSMQTGSANAGSWLLATTLEHHEINDLYAGSKKIKDETERKRSVQSLLLEVSHGFNNKWSFSSLLSFVKHRRQVGISEDSISRARGLGDGVLLIKYTPQRIGVVNRYFYSLGGGVRLPLGENDVTSNGLLLSEDMQPGSGALGYVVWAYGAHSFSAQGLTQIFTSFNASFNGENSRQYQFGDEQNISLGLAYQSEFPVSASLALLARRSQADRRFGSKVPNTGGLWLDLMPAVQYKLTQQWALRFSSRVPLRRELNGALQFTTSEVYALGMSYQF